MASVLWHRPLLPSFVGQAIIVQFFVELAIIGEICWMGHYYPVLCYGPLSSFLGWAIVVLFCGTAIMTSVSGVDLYLAIITNLYI